ncbi:hypothetical protein BT93_L2513 [Corymbia citriodora subsp. variegata]|uniref:DUF1764-domain-containing protein n=1 Tax=Corymbia citriodora subsp. variegata TaxID=360336 RepID=A0A8T0CM33_CORYI|nr:hypothetical protein BT93_L2513 [Corymbia citriodora subsp. variegata]
MAGGGKPHASPFTFARTFGSKYSIRRQNRLRGIACRPPTHRRGLACWPPSAVRRPPPKVPQSSSISAARPLSSFGRRLAFASASPSRSCRQFACARGADIVVPMPKKSSLKAPDQGPEMPVVKEEKASPPTKKSNDEIDDIFATKKRKKSEKGDAEKPAENGSGKTKKMKKKKKNKGLAESALGDAPSRSRKKTADGLTIYTEDELGINKADGGDTPLCPFDCSCCF